MFLVERCTSLFVYALALLIASVLVGKMVRKQAAGVLFVYLITLCIFAFAYKPYVTADLYRLREYMEYWIHKDWSGVFRYAFTQSSTPAWVLYSYVLCKLGNINWIQTVTCLWCFGNIFYVISHEINYQQIDGKYRGQLLFYIMAVGAFYLQTISGIRSMLGISIVVFCFYRETVEEKSIFGHIPLWMFAALIHTSTMILVISRFAFLLIQNTGTVRKVIMVFLCCVGAFAAYSYLGRYIIDSVEYGTGYLGYSGQYVYIWEEIIGLMEICETIYVLIAFQKKSKNHNLYDKYRALYVFSWIWTVISVIALPLSYSVFRRYTMLCTLTTIPLAAILMNKEGGKKHSADTVFRVLLVWSFLIFVLSGIRGDLCGYKFFVLS